MLLAEEGKAIMCNFYVDESIHKKGNFMIVSWVYSCECIEQKCLECYKEKKINHLEFEFKSGNRFDGISDDQKKIFKELRECLYLIIGDLKFGISVFNYFERYKIKDQLFLFLKNTVQKNKLSCSGEISVFCDQGLLNSSSSFKKEKLSLQCGTEFVLHENADSKKVLGLQLADLVAHTSATMFLEELGIKSKKFNDDSTLGFELWNRLRRSFFSTGLSEKDMESGEFNVEVKDYGFFTSNLLEGALFESANKLFKEMYYGCIY